MIRIQYHIHVMEDIERQVWILLDKVVKKSKNIGLINNCKKAECIVISTKDSLKCQIQIVVRLKHFQKLRYLSAIITDHWM